MRALGPTNTPTTASRPRAAPAIEALLHAHGAARSTGRVDLIKRK